MYIFSKWPSSFGMTVLGWMCFLLLIRFLHCYENLSRKPTTAVSQSSTYKSQIASYANDNNLQRRFRYCAQTAIGQPIAWFQVDLGEPRSIKSVTIYYRNDDGWPPYRFKKFYLDVSNLSAAMTDTTQRTRCYTDRSTGLPDSIIEIPCKQTARYIIVETTYDAPEDDKFEEYGAVLEICEIQVYAYQQTNTNTPDNTVTIVGIVLSVIIVLTGSIITFLLWRRNKTLSVKKELKENVKNQTDTHELSDIPNCENPYENQSPYAELGTLDQSNTYEDLHQYTEVF